MFQLFCFKNPSFKQFINLKNGRNFTTFQNQKEKALINSIVHKQITLFAKSKKSKKIIQLNSQNLQIYQSNQQKQSNMSDLSAETYLKHKKQLQSIPWQSMPFDQLCSIDTQLLNTLQIELKKQKFNISDQEFLQQQLKNRGQQKLPLTTYQQLSKQYKKVYSLLKGTNDYFEEYPKSLEQQIPSNKQRYLNQIYITDLKNDQQLLLTIARFVKHVSKPQRLQAFTEPTFIKFLLGKKRQLMLLGIPFQTKKQVAEKVKRKQQILYSQKQISDQLPSVKILQILNYEYQFWQDVKHNRSKNGSEQHFVIQTKQVPNPNQSILLRQQYPTIKMKFIARLKPLKDGQRCFCIKAQLLIEINQSIKRKVKVEWKGPSSTWAKEDLNMKRKTTRKSKQPQDLEEDQQDNDQYARKVGYLIIDYEDIFDGNPTIKPIFYF